MTNDRSAPAMTKLREQAIALFRQGVAASDPERAVISALEPRRDEIAAAKRVILIAFGKAACPMTRAALPFVSDKLHLACAVTNRENLVAVPGVDGAILDPRSTWADKAAYDRQAAKLVNMFAVNFEKFEPHVDAAILGAAPRLQEAAE